MKIFKFGGASIKDAESVKNVANIIRTEGAKDTLVVISAMGKMTNAFEKLHAGCRPANSNPAQAS